MPNKQFIGKSIHDLPTPSLLVDLELVNSNLAHMQHVVSGYKKDLRPHVKTHKCSQLARLQIAAGAIGVTCATLGEARAMAKAGIQDILIANQLVTLDKLEQVAQLQKLSDIKFVVDSAYGIHTAGDAARQLGCIFEVLVEVDIGGKRCGAQSPEETLGLVQQVADCATLRFGGLQGYNGGTNYILNPDERELRNRASDDILRASAGAVREHFSLPRISGAGSGNAPYLLQYGTLTEIQAGSYVYSDTTYRQLGPYQPAVYVLSTVLSHPLSGRLVMDAGLKTVGTEFGKPEVVGFPELEFEHFSEEHLQWEANGTAYPHIGEKVMVIPSHCCTTVNHYRNCFVFQKEKVVDVWEIDGF